MDRGNFTKSSSRKCEFLVSNNQGVVSLMNPFVKY